MLDYIKGQEQAISVLSHAIHSDKIGQAYLFYGPEGVGKFTTALYFGMALNCQSDSEEKPCGVCNSCKKFLQFNHPDLIYIFPSSKLDMSLEGEIKNSKSMPEYEAYLKNKIETPWKEFFFSANTEIRIDSIRYLIQRLSRTLNEAKYRICIIENAECMNGNTAGAFLKTLEEPPEKTILILTTTQPKSLLPTILSRCQHLRFHSLPSKIIEQIIEETMTLDKVESKTYARIANGNLKQALHLCESGKHEARAFMIRFFELMLARDDLKFLEFLNETKGSKRPTFYAEVVNLFIILIGDLAYFHDAQELIVNVDMVRLFESCYQANPRIHEELPAMLEKMEKMYFRIEQNVNTQLVLTGIYHIFQKALYPYD